MFVLKLSGIQKTFTINLRLEIQNFGVYIGPMRGLLTKFVLHINVVHCMFMFFGSFLFM